jgi:hypothetical protein
MRIAGLLSTLLMLGAGPTAAEVAVQTKGAVQVVGKAQLLPRQKSGFARFKGRARDFSGAYYISTGRDDGSFWVDEHRLEDAKAYAKAACEERGGPCVLYAVIVPTGAPAGQGKVLKGIDGSLARTLASGQRKGDKGSFGAAAANRMGQFGVGWGYKTREIARKEALFTCIKGIERRVFKDQVSASVYNRAVAQGRFDCKLVTEWQR